jgi:hypothetical protein
MIIAMVMMVVSHVIVLAILQTKRPYHKWMRCVLIGHEINSNGQCKDCGKVS